ncbi:MAG: ECF-type sigma factor [Phycisphaerae bacterium]
MATDERRTATRLLEAVTAGDPSASRDLLPLVYEELRTLARARLRHIPPGQTLQPTALVHEAYLRLIHRNDPSWDGRGHFFAAAARAMRDILVEYARRKMARKRGGGRHRVALEEVEPAFVPPAEDVLAVDEALKRLEQDDPRKGQIVNMRYYAGMTAAETAAALGISVGTVGREWRYVRAWLERELRTRDAPEA